MSWLLNLWRRVKPKMPIGVKPMEIKEEIEEIEEKL